MQTTNQSLFSIIFSFVDRPLLLFGCLILLIPFYIMLGRAFFGDWESFLEHLRYLYQPWWLSALRGEYYEDQWSGIKFLFYLIFCAAMVTTVYKLLKLVL